MRQPSPAHTAPSTTTPGMMTVPSPTRSVPNDINPFPSGEILPLHLLHHSFLPFQKIPGINEALYRCFLPREYPRQPVFPAFPGQQMPFFTPCFPCPAKGKPYGRLRGKIMHGHFYDFPFFLLKPAFPGQKPLQSPLPEGGKHSKRLYSFQPRKSRRRAFQGL